MAKGTAQTPRHLLCQKTRRLCSPKSSHQRCEDDRSTAVLGMELASWETIKSLLSLDVLSADTADVLAVDTRDVLSADTSHVLSGVKLRHPRGYLFGNICEHLGHPKDARRNYVLPEFIVQAMSRKHLMP